jgi:CheY-like chemotaxis protein
MKPVRAGQLRSAIVSLCRGSPGPAANAPAATGEPAYRMDGARILLAEDNATNTYAVTKMIERLGGEIVATRDGVEAVEAAKRSAYDLILMDMQMPNMDGIEATRRIRAIEGPNRATPILALTANAFTEDVERCLVAGMNAHLAKPLRQQTLIDAMRRHLPTPGKTARSA